MRIEAGRLESFVASALARRGVPESDAATVAACLVEAEMEGVSSHGLLRLPFLLRRLDRALIRPVPEIRVESTRAGAVLVDGGNGLGPVVGLRAATEAVARARSAGVALAVVRGSNHLGSLGFYVRRMAEAGVAGLAFSNSPPALAPPGGRRPLLGTNPIAAGFPTRSAPVVIDLATAQVARGRILKASAAGEPIPEGWAVDSDGRPTTDAAAALSGSLVPLGGAKGFALALVVEVLSAVVGGANLSPDVAGTFSGSARPSGAGHAFLAIDPEAFAPGFSDRMEALAGLIREAEAAPGAPPVRVPGDRRERERRRRQSEGVEVTDELAAELSALAGGPVA